MFAYSIYYVYFSLYHDQTRYQLLKNLAAFSSLQLSFKSVDILDMNKNQYKIGILKHIW